MTLHVAGGFYRETCHSPPRSGFFGSGGRAAAALQGLGPERCLHTYVSAEDEPALAATAENGGFDFRAYRVPRSVAFDYFHPLAAPAIDPPPGELDLQAAFMVEADQVLRFGILEGDAVVHAGRAVYDPQSAFNPRPFHENGSTADQLAVVTNRGEAARLTGCRGIEEAGAALLGIASTRVVVVKDGPHGAHVFEAGGGYRRVPAYRTERVYSIGSGDVFSAVFALGWAVEGRDPAEAASRASLATAFYCEEARLPIPAEALVRPRPEILPRREDGRRLGAFDFDVYLAAPFFNVGQLWLVEELRGLLVEEGLRVFSPLHDVGRGGAATVAGPDLDGLHRSQMVLACLDGLDSGTVFEVGYARARGLPVVALAEGVGEEDLKMIWGSGCEVVGDLTTAFYRTIWRLLEGGPKSP